MKVGPAGLAPMVQEVDSVALHFKSAVLLSRARLGSATMVAVGVMTSRMRFDAGEVPPGPVQVMLYGIMPNVLGVTDVLVFVPPAVKPVPVQEVAPVVVHESVELFPSEILFGDAAKEVMTAGFGASVVSAGPEHPGSAG